MKKVIIIAPLKSIHIEKTYKGLDKKYDFFSFLSSHRQSNELLSVSWPSFLFNILTRKYDIIVIHYLSWNILSGLIFKPFVSNLIGVCWGSDVYQFAPKYKFFWQVCASRFDKLVATSLNMCNFVEENFGIPVEYRPFGLSSEFSSYKPEARNGSRKKTVRFVTVKELRYKAGIDLSIMFVEKLAMKLKNTQIIYDIYGVGPELNNLKIQLKDIKTKNFQVNFLGQVSQKELLDIYENYDFFIGLSRSESLGLSFIEAAHFGIPPIISITPGPLEVFGMDYDLKYSMDIEDAEIFNKIAHAIFNFDEYKRLSLYAQSRVKHYHWEEWSKWYRQM